MSEIISKNNKLLKSREFYRRLYCKQKNSLKTKGPKSVMVEAAKSWVCLNENEKKQFQTKYKEYVDRYNKKCTEKLKNAEAFMKVRNNRLQNELRRNSVDNSETSNSKSNDNNKQSLDAIDLEPVLEKEELKCELEGNATHHSEPEEHSLQQDVLDMESIQSNTQTVIPEPLPLTLKSGRELFQLLNSTNEDTNWSALPKTEKHQYSRAVLLLKKDYLSKYKTYLESLTDKDLYEHYKKVI